MNNILSDAGIIHNALGGIGVIAVLILPVIMLKIVPKYENIFFHRFSHLIFTIGIVSIIFFLFRFTEDNINILSLYKGLWQRLFMVNTYIYFITISFLMVKKYFSIKKSIQ